MSSARLGLCCLAILAAGCATTVGRNDSEVLRQQVREAETAFARTMAQRDFEAFNRFVDNDAVFLNDGQPLRGKAAIAAHWHKFFSDPVAPFSWRPDQVEVLESGQLAQTVGSVHGPDGELIAHFYSTWHRQAPGVWRVVFDNGYTACKCPAGK